MKLRAKKPGRKPNPLARTMGGVFLYAQLADTIRRQIKSGALQPGARLPSMMSLAATYSVNKVTVRRAMAQLYAAGLIYSVPSQGTYVAENRPLTTFSLQRRPLTVGLLSLDNAVDRSEPYFMEIIQGMRDELGRYQGSLTMLPVRKNEPEIRIISRLVRAQLDAIVYLGMPNSPILQKLIREGPPGVLVDCRTSDGSVSSVMMDHASGAAQMTDHLLNLGHSAFVILTAGEKLASTAERLRGVHDSLFRAGLPDTAVRVVHGNGSRDSGFAIAGELLRAHEPPTALFCFSDEMAAGALQAVPEHTTWNVPGDISISGFDDTPWSTATHPALTTVCIDKTFVGRVAIQRVWSMFKDREPATLTMLPARLVVRASTGPVRKRTLRRA